MAGSVKVEAGKVVINSGDDNIEIGGVDFATSSEMDIYVREPDGSDSNSGTSSEPLASIVEAEKRIPSHVNHTIRIHVGPHSGNGYEVPSFRKRDLNAHVYIIGDGGGGSSDGFTEILSSTAALAGSSNQSVKTSGLSTTEYDGFGEYYGATIEILTGAAAGDRRTIRNNTATDIYPNVLFSAAVAENDTYRIIKPEVVIYYSDEYTKVFASNFSPPSPEHFPRYIEPRLWLINFRFTKSTSYGYWEFNIINSGINMFGILFTEEVDMHLNNSSIHSGYEIFNSLSGYFAAPSAVSDLGIDNELSWNGWGIVVESQTFDQGTFYLRGDENSSIRGGVNAEGLSITYGSLFMLFGSIWGGGYNCVSVTPRAFAYINAINTDILIGSLSSDVGLSINGKLATLAFGPSKKIVIKSSGNAINVIGDGDAMLSSVTGGIEIETTIGIGINVREGGKVLVSLETPIMSTGGGDFSENNGLITRSISELVSGSFFSDFIHGSIRRN